MEIPLDVRVLATTNRNPERAVREGRLRDDLYYRLSVCLRSNWRRCASARRISSQSSTTSSRLRQLSIASVRGADAAFLQTLRAYSWPGNARQLRNVVERALVVSCRTAADDGRSAPELQTLQARAPGTGGAIGDSSLQDVEREMINRTIEFAAGNKTKAAEMLGISLRTLYNRLERLDDDKERPKPA